jgi:hypothetical protein
LCTEFTRFPLAYQKKTQNLPFEVIQERQFPKLCDDPFSSLQSVTSSADDCEKFTEIFIKRNLKQFELEINTKKYQISLKTLDIRRKYQNIVKNHPKHRRK